MIFHLPLELREGHVSGSQMRPQMMLEAFKALGLEVDVVSGPAKQRAEQIRAIESNLKSGVSYEFCYSESSTMPTLLTERHHLPTHPFLDFGFLAKLRRHGVPVGLFYRDIYWRFPSYKAAVPWHQRIVTGAGYRYDLVQYRRVVDVLYLPSAGMAPCLRSADLEKKSRPLPPGCVSRPSARGSKPGEGLHLIYVGGVTPPSYDLRPLIQGLKGVSGVRLSVVCREKEWEAQAALYAPLLTAAVTVRHLSGEALNELYDTADVFANIRSNDPYLDFAMPVKLFEAVSFGLPIITTEGTTMASFVEKEGIGWSIPNEGLADLLGRLTRGKAEWEAKRARVEERKEHHTWLARARQVQQDLATVTAR